ncbi:MAG: hypothetical protein U0269_04930 [Polyangiales bacterium]
MSAVCASVLLLVALAAALFVWQRGRVYRAVFSAAHVREFVGVVRRLRPHAIALGAEVPKDLQDKRVATTSAGLHIAYTAMPHDENVEHHVSVSLLGGYTATAVGNAFVRLAMEALGFSEGQYVVGRSQRGVWHGAVQLDREAHEHVAKRELAALDDGAIEALFARVQDKARDLSAIQAINVR